MGGCNNRSPRVAMLGRGTSFDQRRDRKAKHRASLDQRRSLSAPRLPLHQIHRHLPKTGRLLRLNVTSSKACGREAGARVHHAPRMRDQISAD